MNSSAHSACQKSPSLGDIETNVLIEEAEAPNLLLNQGLQFTHQAISKYAIPNRKNVFVARTGCKKQKDPAETDRSATPGDPHLSGDL